ncbi:MAG TPA: alpha/beta hydrolase [Cytophagales bacterium]|nr:alpha/beta hydrolase [Cytophagales bacterium]HAA23420.1 alpha/beta hydrolase [Cytophagales bacterium]HAP58099.1 alpha/beta hydrolase [Cytophagales bacterium]
MKLFSRVHGSGQPLVILHGVFGSADNWLTLGKRFAEDFEVHLVDQRNHGLSPHSEEFSYPAMAADLEEYLEDHALENPILVGHSMGGKVVMQFAVDNPDRFQKMVVVDIAPRQYPVHHTTILEGLTGIDLPNLKSRGEADKQLALSIKEMGVRQFLLKNLTRNSEKQFAWKINLPVIKREIETIGVKIDGEPVNKPSLFVRGFNSTYIQEADYPQIKQLFPLAQIESLNAGHWVHAEKPEETYQLISDFAR